MKYTFVNPRNNESLETELTPILAAQIIKENAPMSDDFAHNLAEMNYWSLSQRFWLMKKGEQYNPNKPAPAKIEVGKGFARIQAMFAKAKESLKKPKIVLQNNEGEEVKISLAPDSGRNKDFIYIKIAENYAGKISPDGEFFPVQSCGAGTIKYLESFSENPEIIAAKYGRLTGSCCFCARHLTDDRSVSVGYGPICADRFGLKWGE